MLCKYARSYDSFRDGLLLVFCVYLGKIYSKIDQFSLVIQNGSKRASDTLGLVKPDISERFISIIRQLSFFLLRSLLTHPHNITSNYAITAKYTLKLCFNFN